ncbi:MAG: TrmH family RNA methyltransferase [Lentimicrobiaceae bacterium]|nr:TrmH family RNA methyltransferase [Lentimicrobiaceae bacterium]
MNITSASNPRIKYILQLQKDSKLRRTEGKFVVEGYREIYRALASGYVMDTLYICDEIIEGSKIDEIRKFENRINNHVQVSRSVFNRVAYRNDVEGVFAVAKTKSHDISQLHFPENPLLLVAQSIEKPGNVGAVLRTCDAVGVDAVILCDSVSDLYNPNTIRSSLGCVFSLPIAVTSSKEAISFLTDKKIQINSAFISDDAISCYSVNYKNASAIVVGSEADGLSADWSGCSTNKIMIPMNGIADSLNVSVSAAVILFEAYRQRVHDK